MRAGFRVLDSKFLSRVGNFDVLLKIIGLGATIVLAIALVAAGIVDVAGWIPLACFAIWVVLAGLLIATGMLRTAPHAFTSPAARIAMRYDLPGAGDRVVVALDNAQKSGRELIADVAVFEPLNKHGGDFAQRIAAYRAEVAELIDATDLLNDDWALLWERVPRRIPHGVTCGPLTLEMVADVLQYLGHKMWQLQWMVDFIQTGEDRPVRHIRTSIAAYDREDEVGARRSDIPAPAD